MNGLANLEREIVSFVRAGDARAELCSLSMSLIICFFSCCSRCCVPAKKKGSRDFAKHVVSKVANNCNGKTWFGEVIFVYNYRDRKQILVRQTLWFSFAICSSYSKTNTNLCFTENPRGICVVSEGHWRIPSPPIAEKICV